MTSTLNETQQQTNNSDNKPPSPIFVGCEVDAEENTKLIKAAALGDEDLVKQILSNGSKNIDAQNIYGFTALLYALSKGYKSIASILLDFGANVHISALEGLSPLHMAVIHCDESTILRLVQCGAFLGVQDEAGDTILHWAIREGKRDVLAFLLPLPDSKSTKFFGCQSVVDIKNEDGETPLHLAACLGEEESCDLLIKSGANVDIKDNDGLTPIDSALDNSYYTIAHMLSNASKGKKRYTSNSHRHEPYRRNCAVDVQGEFERKKHLSPLPVEIPPSQLF